MNQLCQSITLPKRLGLPCTVSASRTLVGVHLCGLHEISWRRRLQLGEKIRIHPGRALPLDHHCGDVPTESKRCTSCGELKPLSREHFSGHGVGRLRSTCRACDSAYAREWWRRTHMQPALAERSGAEESMKGARSSVDFAASTTSAPEPSAGHLPDSTSTVGPLTFELAGKGMPSPVHTGGRHRYVYQVDVVCLHCNRPLASVQLDDPHQPARLPIGLRCGHCGGPPVASGDVLKRSLPEPIAPGLERPKRGRPPKVVAA